MLGIVGVGKIGTRMARVAQAFGMSVVGWQPRSPEQRCKEAQVECAASLDDLMQRSDFVSVHLALTEATRGLIGAWQLARMKARRAARQHGAGTAD